MTQKMSHWEDHRNNVRWAVEVLKAATLDHERATVKLREANVKFERALFDATEPPHDPAPKDAT